jgi:hypothetical protein
MVNNYNCNYIVSNTFCAKWFFEHENSNTNCCNWYISSLY